MNLADVGGAILKFCGNWGKYASLG